MTRRPPVPTEIRRQGTHGVRIFWDDGHQSEYTNDYLRNHCPCAVCRERPRRTLPIVGNKGGPLYAKEIGVVGRYAVSVKWSDGHDSGIYGYQTLRGLCPCEECRPKGPPGSSKRTAETLGKFESETS